MARDWNALGIHWTESDVQRQHGDHATDRAILGKAQIPVLADMDLAKAAGLTPAILKGVNGTSWRVMAQDVCRGLLEKGIKDVETTRERIYARLLSIRQAGTVVQTVTVVKRPLPDGTMYEGSDENEFRANYMAALIDAGVDANVARTMATTIAW